MAQRIDDETIENVCILAKLFLSEEDKKTAMKDMQNMLDYVDKLKELDTEGVEPLTHIFGDENVFREDVVTNGDDKEAMLSNAPKAKEWQYQVPKTIG
jgi:aspartyl-tRNA(Asn)/glutamyl-tRNA(Gln) amidotransferase subunit C